MKLISKKTPFIIAGGEALRRKIVEGRQQAAKRRRRKKILTITGIGALAGGIALVAKKRRGEQFPPAVTPRPQVTPDEIADLRQDKPQGQPEEKSKTESEDTPATKAKDTKASKKS